MLGNNMKRQLYMIITGSSVAMVSMTGCGNPLPPVMAATASGQPTVAVSRVPLVVATLRRTVEEPGRIVPWEEAVLQARIAAQVTDVLVDIGSFVRGPSGNTQGELLVRLDAPELVAEHTQRLTEAKLAEAELEQSKHALKAARAGQTAVVALIREADAAIKRTMANQERWRSENRRVAALVRDRVLDQQTSEEIGNQARAAEAHHEEALARLETAGRARDKADADVVHAEGAVLTAAAKLDVARAIAARTATYLEFRSVRAPFDGVITKRSCSPGEILEVGSSPPLFTVARIDPARAVAYLPETLAARLENNGDIVVRFPSGGGPDMKARISRTGWALDNTSRTLRVEADIVNPAPHPVRVGAYIKMAIPLVWTDVRVLPKSAVIRQQDQSVAFVARAGKVRRVIVETGGADEKNIEIRSASLAGEVLDLSKPQEFLSPASGRTEGDTITD